MTDSSLIRSIQYRNWFQAKRIIREKPYLVYVGAYPRCYIDLDGGEVIHNNESDNNDSIAVDDEQQHYNLERASEPSGRLHRRSAIHELCRMCVALDDDAIDGDGSDRAVEAERKEMYALARLMLTVSHCTSVTERMRWRTMHNYAHDQSLLNLYEGDQSPLHILCSRNVDFGMLQLIFENIHCRGNEAMIPLPTIRDLLKNKNELGCTPLHYLSENQSCPLSTLQYILDLCGFASFKDDTIIGNLSLGEQQPTTYGWLSDAMLQGDDDDETPLHWALSAQIEPMRFRILLRYGGKQALWHTQIQDEYPFDQLARHCEEDLLVCDDVNQTERENFELFEKYLAIVVYDDMDVPVKEQNREGSRWLPLHLMASSALFPCPPYVFDLGLRYYAAQISELDDSKKGMLPLHVALSHNLLAPYDRKRHESLVLKIFQAFQDGARMRSREGRLPLHYAVESQTGLGVVRELWNEFPASLSMRDPLTNLFPFSLAAVTCNDSLDVVYELLRACPTNLG